MKKLKNYALAILAVLGGSGASNVNGAPAPGLLKIENNLNSHVRNVSLRCDDSYYPGASDLFDTYDGDANSQPNGFPNIYSSIVAHNLWADVRAENSLTPYDIKLSFEGNLNESTPNYLKFSFPFDGKTLNNGEYHFGDKDIIFTSDRLKYGRRLDVRPAADPNNAAIVALMDVPAGEYSQWNPYGSASVTMGAGYLGDFTNPSIDYATHFDSILL